MKGGTNANRPRASARAAGGPRPSLRSIAVGQVTSFEDLPGAPLRAEIARVTPLLS
jgi:hypothetical protein